MDKQGLLSALLHAIALFQIDVEDLTLVLLTVLTRAQIDFRIPLNELQVANDVFGYRRFLLFCALLYRFLCRISFLFLLLLPFTNSLMLTGYQ